MNTVTLIGHAASTPHQVDGRKLAHLRIAVPRSDGSGADFFTVSAWAWVGEKMVEQVRTGTRDSVEGWLRHNTWTAEDGTRRGRVEIVARRINVLSHSTRGRLFDANAADAAERTEVTMVGAGVIA